MLVTTISWVKTPQGRFPHVPDVDFAHFLGKDRAQWSERSVSRYKVLRESAAILLKLSGRSQCLLPPFLVQHLRRFLPNRLSLVGPL